MTVKEIAELCGVKSEQTVKNWAHKIGDDPAKNWQGIIDKLAEAEKSGKDPADFTLEETLVIIGEGGKNKALASLLAENAVNKDKLTVVDRRYTGLQEDIERIIDSKIQDSIDNPGKMDAFITRFCMIYGQDREFKYKNIRAFSGFYLKDTEGVCGEGWD